METIKINWERTVDVVNTSIQTTIFGTRSPEWRATLPTGEVIYAMSFVSPYGWTFMRTFREDRKKPGTWKDAGNGTAFWPDFYVPVSDSLTQTLSTVNGFR